MTTSASQGHASGTSSVTAPGNAGAASCEGSPACPGWRIADIGDIIPCGCESLTAEQAFRRAEAWARSLPVKHEAIEGECDGCCGFCASQIGGSRVYGSFALLRSDECGVFEYDDDAQAAARAAYAATWPAAAVCTRTRSTDSLLLDSELIEGPLRTGCALELRRHPATGLAYGVVRDVDGQPYAATPDKSLGVVLNEALVLAQRLHAARK